MRKFMFILTGIAAIGTLAFAAGSSKTSKTAFPAPVAPLNNVVKMDAAGHRTALCCCGAVFTVRDDSPTMDHGATTFYMCSEGCKEAALNSTPEQTAVTMANWHEKYATYALPTNTFERDGKLWARCGCGKEFQPTADTPVIIENGYASYCCSEACHQAFMSLSAADRLAKEMAELNGNSEVSTASH
jgi:hypothetical protein